MSGDQQAAPDFCTEWLGIPPGRRPPDYYTLLGLDRSESNKPTIERHVSERIKRLRTLSMKFPSEATEYLNLVTKAKLCLLDDAERSKYDTALATLDQQPVGSAPSADATTEKDAAAETPQSGAVQGITTPSLSEFGYTVVDELESANATYSVSSTEESSTEESVAEAAENEDYVYSDDDAWLDNIDEELAASSIDDDDEADDADLETPTGKRYCPHCGNGLLTREKSCQTCSGTLADRAAWLNGACPHCLVAISPGTVICRRCNTDLAINKRSPQRPHYTNGTVRPFGYKHHLLVETRHERMADLYESDLTRERRKRAKQTKRNSREPSVPDKPPIVIAIEEFLQDRERVKRVSTIAGGVCGALLAIFIAIRILLWGSRTVLAMLTGSPADQPQAEIQTIDSTASSTPEAPSTPLMASATSAEVTATAESPVIPDEAAQARAALIQEATLALQNSSNVDGLAKSLLRLRAVLETAGHDVELYDLADRLRKEGESAYLQALDRTTTSIPRTAAPRRVKEFLENDASQVFGYIVQGSRNEQRLFAMLLLDAKSAQPKSEDDTQYFADAWKMAGERSLPAALSLRTAEFRKELQKDIRTTYEKHKSEVVRQAELLARGLHFIEALDKLATLNVDVEELFDAEDFENQQRRILQRAQSSFPDLVKMKNWTECDQVLERMEAFAEFNEFHANQRLALQRLMGDNESTPKPAENSGPEPADSSKLTATEARNQLSTPEEKQAFDEAVQVLRFAKGKTPRASKKAFFLVFRSDDSSEKRYSNIYEAAVDMARATRNIGRSKTPFRNWIVLFCGDDADAQKQLVNERNRRGL